MQKRIVIENKLSGSKIDKAIVHYLPKLSRRAIRRALDSGHVSINGKIERFASKTVQAGNILVVKIVEENAKRKKNLIIVQEPFIAYEDEFILAINKPPFLLSQKTVNKNSIEAKSFLLNYLKEKKRTIDFKLILCHRLDKETSGILIFAKSKESSDWIMSQFKERKCHKTYEALCFGKATKDSWKQKNYLSSLNTKSQRVEVVNSGGKTAITSFKVLEKDLQNNTCLIEAKPLTGRSHQIRVQLSHNNLSILGDKKYYNRVNGKEQLSKKTYEHHLLHAKKLEIRPSPESKMIEILAEKPKLFRKEQSRNSD